MMNTINETFKVYSSNLVKKEKILSFKVRNNVIIIFKDDDKLTKEQKQLLIYTEAVKWIKSEGKLIKTNHPNDKYMINKFGFKKTLIMMDELSKIGYIEKQRINKIKNIAYGYSML